MVTVKEHDDFRGAPGRLGGVVRQPSQAGPAVAEARRVHHRSPSGAGGSGGIIGRGIINHHYFLRQAGRNFGQHQPDGAPLVVGRNEHADARKSSQDS